jgi:2-oxoglutarate dehydrogenase E2 component (dihydrolipoamide succinyltransferase)
MACRQRLCCSLLRTAAASPSSITRPIRATLTWKSTYSLPKKSSFSTTRLQYAETIVKVPEMAESISEGTLSSFSKQPGDYVEQDEEIASIETDKV